MNPIDPEAIEAALANAPAPKVKRCETCNAILLQSHRSDYCYAHEPPSTARRKQIVHGSAERPTAKRDRHGRYMVEHPEMSAREYVKMKLTEGV